MKYWFGLSLSLMLALAPPAEAQSRREKREKAAAAAAAAAAKAAQLAPSVKNGVTLWQREDWAGAVAMWRPFAEAGNTDAMFNMGQAHKLGRGLPQNDDKARQWFRRAAEKNHRPSQANLGILLFQIREKEEALSWLKLAADAGEPRAQYVYGVALWNGDGVPRSLSFAYAYLARSADQGLQESKGALDRLTPMLAPVDRANGWALAAALARGDGKVVPLTTIKNPAPELVAPAAVPAPVPQTPTIDPAVLGTAEPKAAFRIQIGAYSRRDLADADVEALRQSNAALIAGLAPFYQPANGLVRLQFGSFATRDLAAAACERFQTAGRSCLIVDAP